MKLKIIITGRAYHATASLPDELTLPDSATLDDALAALAELSPDDQPLSDNCIVALSGRHLGTLGTHETAPLTDGDELALIAPVAGG